MQGFQDDIASFVPANEINKSFLRLVPETTLQISSATYTLNYPNRAFWSVFSSNRMRR